MPLGLNRTDANVAPYTSFRNGTPIDTSTHKFGNTVNWSPSPAHFGNPEPSSGTEQNKVNWSPSPAHFGTDVRPASTVIYVSSLAGIHQNSNLTTGGGTDDTSIIQAALNATYSSPLVLIQDGVSLITGLNLLSNTTIKCLNSSCGFFLANNSNREMLRNTNRSGTVQTDHDITVDGGYYNGNKANQSAGVKQADNSPIDVMTFAGITNLTIKNLTIYASTAWAIGIGNFTNVTVDTCTITQATTVANLTTDAVDLRGPGTNATLSNLNCTTGDDALAVNTRAYSSTIIGPYFTGGNISDVTISNITLNGCWAGVDLITDDVTSMSGVTISGLSGTVQNYGLYLNRDLYNTPGTSGSWANISLSGAVVTQSGTPFGDLIPAGLWLIDGVASTVTLALGSTQVANLVTSHASVTGLTVNGFARGNPVGPNAFGGRFGQAKQIPAVGGSSLSLTLPGLTAIGSTLVVFATAFKSGGITITGVSDTVNVWTRQNTFSDGATGHVGEVWTAPNTSTTAKTITVSFNGSAAGATLEAAEYMYGSVDAASSMFLDGSSESTVTCPSVTTTVDQDAVLGLGSGVNASPGSAGAGGFSTRLTGVGAYGVLVDKVALSIGTYTPSWTMAAGAGNYRSSLALKNPM